MNEHSNVRTFVYALVMLIFQSFCAVYITSYLLATSLYMMALMLYCNSCYSIWQQHTSLPLVTVGHDVQ